MGFDWGWAKPLSRVKGRFESVTSRFWLVVVAPVGGGEVYHVFESRFHVPRVPWERRILVERAVFPTASPPSAYEGTKILETGGWASQNLDFQALRTP